MYSFGFGVDAPTTPATPVLPATQARQARSEEIRQAQQAQRQVQIQAREAELSQLPAVSTTSPGSMTNEQLEQESRSLSSCYMYQNYFPNDQRVISICNRRKAVNQELNNRRIRTATFDSFAAASPIGIAFGSGIAYLLGMSPLRGAVIGGLATGMLPVLVISYLGSRRQS